VIGLSARVNEEGARQVEGVLRVQGVKLLRVHLTGYRLHIDGLFLMVGRDLALINPTLLPFTFLEALKARGIRTIEVDPEDQPFTVNGLAVRPGRVILSETSPRTLDRLDKAGVEVVPLPYEAMYRGGGGIHCSTSFLARDPACRANLSPISRVSCPGRPEERTLSASKGPRREGRNRASRAVGPVGGPWTPGSPRAARGGDRPG